MSENIDMERYIFSSNCYASFHEYQRHYKTNSLKLVIVRDHTLLINVAQVPYFIGHPIYEFITDMV